MFATSSSRSGLPIVSCILLATALLLIFFWPTRYTLDIQKSLLRYSASNSTPAVESVSSSAYDPLFRLGKDTFHVLKHDQHLGLKDNRSTKIAICSMMFGDDENNRYGRLAETHLAYNKRHGYPLFLLDQAIVEKDRLYNKIITLLYVLTQELAKPESERLEWLLWLDADTIIMNKHIPLDIFLPPAHREDVRLLYSKDWNGLNNGVFLLRVSSWSLEVMSATEAHRTWFEEGVFTEQSSMSDVIGHDRYKSGAVEYPPTWFNAYESREGDRTKYNYSPGQLLIHFPGPEHKVEGIEMWLRKLKTERELHEISVEQTSYLSDIREFWDQNDREWKERQEKEQREREQKEKEQKEKEEQDMKQKERDQKEREELERKQKERQQREKEQLEREQQERKKTTEGQSGTI